jgi:hypothetical protein
MIGLFDFPYEPTSEETVGWLVFSQFSWNKSFSGSAEGKMGRQRGEGPTADDGPWTMKGSEGVPEERLGGPTEICLHAGMIS